MTAYCRGRCKDFRNINKIATSKLRYISGKKYCKTCGIWQLTEMTRCLCCSMPMRTRPHKTLNNNVRLEILGIRAI
jgi:hypothetical protein